MSPSPMIIQYWALKRLLPPSRQLRKNNPAVDRMADSMNEYGFKIPILVSSEGEIIDGDLRLKAARKLGFVEVPVIVCDDWTPEQVRGFRLLANRSANWTEWGPPGRSRRTRRVADASLRFKPDRFRQQGD